MPPIIFNSECTVNSAVDNLSMEVGRMPLNSMMTVWLHLAINHLELKVRLLGEFLLCFMYCYCCMMTFFVITLL